MELIELESGEELAPRERAAAAIAAQPVSAVDSAGAVVPHGGSRTLARNGGRLNYEFLCRDLP